MALDNTKGPIPPGNIPVHPTSDPYGFGGKAEGYPHGQATVELDGRTLRDCVFGSAWAHQGPFGPVPFANVFRTNVRNTEKDRALYIRWIHLVPINAANFDVEMHWLLVADFKRLWGAPVTISTRTAEKRDIGIYFPPRTNVDVYYQFNVAAGAAGAGWVVDISVNWIEFDASGDIWPWGNGESKPNPPAAQIAVLGWWP